MASPNWQFHYEVISRALDIIEEASALDSFASSDKFLSKEIPHAILEARQSLAFLKLHCELGQSVKH